MRFLYFICLFLLLSCSFHQKGRSPSSLKNDQLKIGVVGDLEGNYDLLEDFINHGDTLYFENSQVQLRDDARFIFLGDATDRGPGSMRILDTLNDLKKRYPDRVTLLVGNREINKLKILSYIYNAKTKKVPSIVIPWYKKIIKEDMGLDIDDFSDKEFQSFVTPVDNDVIRLKAFLSGMNAAEAFGHRRRELEELNPSKTFSDKDVYLSFLEDFGPNGRMRVFLENAQIGAIYDGNIFVHGAITSENFGHIPNQELREFNTSKWILKLNTWLNDEVNAWFEGDYNRDDLFDYHAPAYGKKMNPKSVIYGRFSSDSGNPKAPSNNLIKKLRQDGIHRIVVGHTPTGDYPIILRKNEFEVLLADSSYSTIKGAPRIIIENENILVETYMPNGKLLKINSTPLDHSNPLGVVTADNARVIGKIEDSNDYLVMKIKKKSNQFSTHYERVDVKELSSTTERENNGCFYLLSLFNRFRTSIYSEGF